MERQKAMMFKDKNVFDHKDMLNTKKSFHLFLDCTDEGLALYDENDKPLDHANYSDIDYVNFSLCSRLDIGGITRHQVDLDICVDEKIIALEVFFSNSLQLLIDYLTNHHVDCIDMVGVIALYQKYPDKWDRELYLRRHFNQIAKKYKLDHPRYKQLLREK